MPLLNRPSRTYSRGGGKKHNHIVAVDIDTSSKDEVFGIDIINLADS